MRSNSAAPPRFTKLELQVLEALWSHGKASIREIHESFPEPRPAYTTVQTVVNRLEGKRALRRLRLLDEILSYFGGRALPMVAQLVEVGKLTPEDLNELQKTIKRLKKERERP